MIFIGSKCKNIAISASVSPLRYVYSLALDKPLEEYHVGYFQLINYVVDSNFIWVIYYFFPDTCLLVK